MAIWERLQTALDEALHSERLNPNLMAMATGLSVVAFVWWGIRWSLTRGAHQDQADVALAPPWKGMVRTRLRELANWLSFSAATGCLMIGMAFHLAGRDIQSEIRTQSARLTRDQLRALGWQAGIIVGIVFAGWLLMLTIRRARRVLQTRLEQRLRELASEESIGRWCGILEKASCALVAIGAAGLISSRLGFERSLSPVAWFALKVVLAVAGVRLAVLAVRGLAPKTTALGERRLQGTRMASYWERLQRLIPLGLRCLESALYVSAASYCVQELSAIAFIGDYGQKFVKCIGIFFIAQVVIELLHVLLNEVFAMHREGAVDQRRQTLIPLVQSGCQYVIYFGIVVMMMEVWGQDTKWLLASAGILGVAVGLGAQNLVTDIVSGFFILFEGQYLVGDTIEASGAKGVVEAIAVRHTQIRDEHGHLHIIPNGQIKQVVNHCKGYVNAVVETPGPLDARAERLLHLVRQAGRALKDETTDVMAEPDVQGVVPAGAKEMTVRAIIKVKPGARGRIESEYRRRIALALAKEAQPESPLVRAA